MWKVSDSQVISRFSTGTEGAAFTAFVDALISAEMCLAGVSRSELVTNLSTSKPDGGVDTEVRAAVPADSFGFLKDNCTMWQYTIMQDPAKCLAKLKANLGGDYSRVLLGRGYAARACVSLSLTPEAVQHWEEELTAVACSVHADAPAVRVLTAGQLARWASEYPGVASYHLGASLPTRSFDLRSWGRSATDGTEQFVEVPEWGAIASEIRAHVDMNIVPLDVVKVVFGMSGVGKTRLVYEVLKAELGANSLVVYAADGEAALNVAHSLVMHDSKGAVLVADDCETRERFKLEDVLRGFRHHVRVVAIASPEPLSQRGQTGLTIEAMPRESLEKVLGLNFPSVPRESRRAIAELTQGYVRLARFLCTQAAMGGALDLGAALEKQDAEVVRRFGDDPSVRDALMLMSLLTKVGFKEGVEQELAQLCQIGGDLSPEKVVSTGKWLRSECGFVGIAGRYMYVTPPIVAMWAFDRAWTKWASDDPDGFIGRIPPQLLESFISQVAEVGTHGAQEAVPRFFRAWAMSLSLADLQESKVTDRLVALTTAQPSEYLPSLRRLLEHASDDQVLSIGAEGSDGRWGPRIRLVWLARNLASFAEYFEDAEAILFRLAVTEPQGNWRYGTSESWSHLFRIVLSQTSAPYTARIAVLRGRLLGTDDRQHAHALRALKEAIENCWPGRVVGHPVSDVIGGRPMPREWRPASFEEGRACYMQLKALLREATESTDKTLAELAYGVVVDLTEGLLGQGEIGYLGEVSEGGKLPLRLRPKLLEHFAHFTYWQEHHAKQNRKVPEDVLNEVKALAMRLLPAGVHDRTVALVGRSAHFYTYAFREVAARAELEELARQLVDDIAVLEAEVPWLLSDDALSGEALGEELGKLDGDARLLKLIYDATGRGGSPLLARGYTYGLLRSYPSTSARVNGALDALSEVAPNSAARIAVAGGTLTAPFARTMALVRAGKIAAAQLVGFLRAVEDRAPTTDEFADALAAIADAHEGIDEATLSWCMTFVAYRFHDEAKGEVESVRANPRALEAVWRIVEFAVRHGRMSGEGEHWIEEIMRSLLKTDADRLACIAVEGLLKDPGVLCEACESVISELARTDPRAVLKYLGPKMLDARTAWRFYVDQYRGLFWSLDESILREWISANGVDAARAVARHLPPPEITSDGQPSVPPLTEFVLGEFEEDDRVAAEFAAGVHGSEVHVGCMSEYLMTQAAFARRFLNHKLRRVREWAAHSERACEAEAKRLAVWEEERWQR